ncbi:MAG: protein kinase domain-containing protein [Myxococcaceae bacterium]
MSDTPTAQLAAPVIPGFEIRQLIGQGTENVIYEAVREGKTFALKIPKADLASGSSAAGARLRREGATLARLNYPGLVKAFEVGEHDGRPYLITELVEGQTLAHVLAQGPQTEAFVRKLGVSLARALADVHRHGLVHRDVKPANILVQHTGEQLHTKLIDFGLVEYVREGQLHADNWVGTFIYSAPEQGGLLKRAVDGRADLYALGVIFFEALAGELPFRGETVADLIRMHAFQPPPDLAPLAPGVSPAFRQVILKLLAKDSDDRYQSAGALISDLLRLDELNAHISKDQPIALGGTQSAIAVMEEVPLYGRAAEMTQLNQLWEAARRGQGGCALVEGEAGAGKSRLVREFLASARENGSLLILTAKASKGDPLPFVTVREVIERYLEAARNSNGQGTSMIRRAAGDYAQVLSRFSKPLAEILGKGHGDSNLHATEDVREQLHAGLAEFILNLAREHKKAVFALDDVQWVDSSSRNVFAYLSKQLKKAPLLVLCTSRNDADSLPTLRQFTDTLGSALECRITLGALNEETVKQVISAHLGGSSVDPRFVSQIATRTNGNAFAIGEYVRTAVEGGFLRPSWGTWLFQRHGLESVELPTNVLELLTQRILLLGADTQRVLRTAAIIGSHFSRAALARACGGDRVVGAALAESIAVRLVERIDEDEYSMVHDRVRESLLSQFSAEEKRQCHQSVAKALDMPEFNDVYSLATHYLAGDVSENIRRVYEVAVSAGRRALEEFSEEKARYYLQEAELLGKKSGIKADPQLLDALAEAALRQGQISKASQMFASTAELFPKGTWQRAGVFQRLARLYKLQFEARDAENYLEDTLRELGISFPRFPATQLLLGLWDWLRAVFIQLTGIGFGTSKGVDRQRNIVVTEVLYDGWAIGTVSFHFNVFTMSILRSLYFGLRLGPSRQLSLSYQNMALLFATTRRARASEKYGLAAERLADELGDRALKATALQSRGMAAALYGDEIKSATLFQGALETYGRWLDPETYYYCAGGFMAGLMFRGLAREAYHWNKNMAAKRAASSVVEAVQGNVIQVYGAPAAAMLGMTHEAAVILRTSREAMGPQNTWGKALVAMCEVLLCLETHDLGERLENAIREFSALKLPPTPDLVPHWPRMFYFWKGYARLAQYRAEQGEERTAAWRRLQDALDEIRRADRVRLPLFHMHSLILHGAAEIFAGRPARARRYLDQAERLAEQVDSPRGHFEVCRFRALSLLALGKKSAAEREARRAFAITVEYGYVPRRRALAQEFPTFSLDPTADFARSRSGAIGTVAATQAIADTRHRHLTALLDLSLASANILDPDKQTQACLNHLVKTLNAERAYLFLVAEPDKQLVFKAGRDDKGESLKEPLGYSRTVIERVRSELRPCVSSGTAEREVLGSESAVAHDLRSIMAAPLMTHNELRGVVYLDSRIAKGVFGEDDIEILQAIASHIAVALESAQLVQVELQRQSLEKDLALTATVQSLLLPSKTTFVSDRLTVAGFFQPATKSGGDWWWHQTRTDGTVVLLLGDVTGHGAGSAMVTAVVAGACHQISTSDPNWQVEVLLRAVDATLHALCRGEYSMTFCVIEIRPDGHLSLWNAAAPPPLVHRSGGALEPMVAPGSPLGSVDFAIGKASSHLQPGDRLLAYTDGAIEIEDAKGRVLRSRRFFEIFKQRQHLPIEAALQSAAKELISFADGREQADDITIVMADWSGAASSSAGTK